MFLFSLSVDFGTWKVYIFGAICEETPRINIFLSGILSPGGGDFIVTRRVCFFSWGVWTVRWLLELPSIG